MADDITVYNLSDDGTSSADTSGDQASVYTDRTATAPASSDATAPSGSSASAITEGDVRVIVKSEMSQFSGDIRVGAILSGQVFILDREGLRMGGTDFATAPFSVDYNGNMVATSATITIASIGGFDIGSDYVRDAADSMGLASTVSGSDDVRFWAGSTFAQRTNAPARVYESGAAVFSDVTVSGTIRSSVFEKDVVTAVGGQLIVANADALDTAMTALDASTLTIKGETTFAVDDILHIKDGTDEEYLRVTGIGSAPTYSVTRDLASAYSADSNPAWSAGTAVVVEGSSDGASAYSGGFLKLLGSGTNSPKYSVFKRTGVGYNSITEYATLGNLNGRVDYVADEYGVAIGTASAYMTYDPTSGLRIEGAASVNGSDLSFQDVFGDGSDGNVTISTDTTLSRDMFYENLTVTTSGSLSYSTIAGSTAGDGSAGYDHGGTAFATIRTSPGDVTDGGVATTNTPALTRSSGTAYTLCNRGMLVFDTSSIPDGATITSATLQLYVTAKSDAMSQSVSIVTRTDPATITTADFDVANWTMTKQATDVTIASVTTSAYNTWTLNATGLSNISKTGKTILGVVMSADAEATAPPSGTGAGDASVTYYTADNGSNEPVLAVSYSYSPTLDPGGYRIHVKDTLTVDGTISRSGNAGGVGGAGGNAVDPANGAAGTAGTGGSALASGTLFGSIVGTAGGAGAGGVGRTSAGGTAGATGSASAAGTAAAHSGTGANGVAGGIGGGDAGADNVAGTAYYTTAYSGGATVAVGAVGVATAAKTPPRTVMGAWQMADVETTGTSLISSSAGSSGGSGAASGAVIANGGSGFVRSGGGGGGGGTGTPGGVVSLYGKNIVVGATGVISANGGAGGAGGAGGSAQIAGFTTRAAGGASGGGGGGGGGGGIVTLVYSSLTNSGSITAAGGSGGVGGTANAGTGTGTARAYDYSGAFANGDYASGQDGSTGTTGNSGIIVQIAV